MAMCGFVSGSQPRMECKYPCSNGRRDGGIGEGTKVALGLAAAHLSSNTILADSVQRTTTQIERRGSIQRVKR